MILHQEIVVNVSRKISLSVNMCVNMNVLIYVKAHFLSSILDGSDFSILFLFYYIKDYFIVH